ncbi:MAG: recombination regulator RecX [Burkholderiales bacterium]|nr:recombination regulator RecX [Burkholderiales bacterium]
MGPQRRPPPDASGDADGAAPHPEAHVRDRALGMLARRDHSRAEMRRKLLNEGADAAVVETVLGALAAAGLQSDQRYAEGVARVRGARFGSQRVAHDLRASGVGHEAESLVAELRRGDFERAAAVWQRKFGHAPADMAERARQMRFLHARGFPAAVIHKVVPRCTRDDDTP